MKTNMAQFYNQLEALKIPVKILEKIKGFYENYDNAQNLEDDCNFYNKQIGDLNTYNCDKCYNKGNIAIIENNTINFAVCECMNIRKGLKRIEKSGLKDLLSEYTFEKYTVENEWQRNIKQKAVEYSKLDITSKWFYIGGQVGCGKTHICTAIVNEFLNKGKNSKYMLWRDEIVELKANIMNDTEYQSIINPLKTIEVLYIDDLFKTEKGKNPTTSEINTAFEILNYRYNSKNLITILSSEKSIDEIINIDESVGSRIYQKTKEYCFVIKNDVKRNYRLK